MHHVDRYGIGKVVDMALDHVGRDRPIHLSFDVGEFSIPICCPDRSVDDRDRQFKCSEDFDAHSACSSATDAFDPAVAPSTGTAVRGGLQWREGLCAVESESRTRRCSAYEANVACGG